MEAVWEEIIAGNIWEWEKGIWTQIEKTKLDPSRTNKPSKQVIK